MSRDVGGATELALAGRYEFVRELGRGASGRVILARDRLAAGQSRALKVAPAALAGRLRWEFEHLRRIAHPNVAAAVELLRVDRHLRAPFRLEVGTAVLVEDLAPGVAASRGADTMRGNPGVLLPWALEVGGAVARALGAVHGAGLVHGDVKPDNVVVDTAPAEARLVDLGLSRAPGPMGHLSGTPAFMAREAFAGELTVATDLYSLGATVHALLGGHGPGETRTGRASALHEVVAKVLAEPRSAEALPAFVPADVRRLIADLLDASPQRRPSAAGEVALRFEALASEHAPDRSPRTRAPADRAPTADAQAARLSVLPLVDPGGRLEALRAALDGSDAIVLCGPHGAGRTRLVQEAMRALQVARVSAGQPVPTYVPLDSHLPQMAAFGEAVVHVRDGDAVDEDTFVAAVRASRVTAGRTVFLLERTVPLSAGAGHLVEIGPLSKAGVADLLAGAGDDKPSVKLVDAAMAASGGLAGRLCVQLAEIACTGRNLSAPDAFERRASLARPASISEDAQELASLLAVAGGGLGPAAVDAFGNAGFWSSAHALVRQGLAAIADDGRLTLRADVAVAERQALGKKVCLRLAGRLAQVELDNAARGHVTFALGRREEAGAAFLGAVQQAMGEGAVERACRVAADAHDLFDDEMPPALRLLWSNALRACARYGEAMVVLGDDDSADTQSLRGELHRLSGCAGEARACATALGEEGDALLARLDLDAGETEAAMARARHVALREASPGVQARALEVMALGALRSGDLSGAEEAADRCLERARASGDVRAAARAESVSASVAAARGQMGAARAGHARAFELAQAAGEWHAAATFLVNLGLSRLDAGEPGPAIAALRDGARRLTAIGRDADVGRALYNVGLAAVLVGDDDLARAALRGAVDAAGRCGDRSAAAFAMALQGELALRSGHLDEAKALVDEAWESVAASPWERAVVASRRAVVLRAAGEEARAREALAAARPDDTIDPSFIHEQDPGAAVELLVAEARLALAAGDMELSLAAIANLRTVAALVGSFEARLRAALVSGEVAEAAGQRERAAGCWSEARGLLDAAAATLEPTARVRLRRVDGYRRAFEARPDALQSAPSTDRWRRLSVLARRLSRERRVSRLYEEILNAAVDLSGAERGMLVVRHDDGQLRVRAARGLDQRRLSADDRRFSQSLAARAMDSGGVVRTFDAVSDADLSAAASVHALSLRSVLAVPLRRMGTISAAIYLDDRMRPGAFTEVEEALLADLADLASIALDGAEHLRAERRNARRLSILRARLSRTVQSQALQLAALRHRTDADGPLSGIVAESASMADTLALASKVATSDLPVLILGESGTGKELVARAVHDLSPRAGAPFVGENCSAIVETLLESALFGHVRGAFTGADQSRMGLFDAAHGGTLFLDEIGEMSPAMQAKLLRVVQDGEVRPVGSTRVRHVDVRLVAATHRDLKAMVARGAFREDLYYRLAVVTVPIAPLRERPADIAPLVAHFVAKHGRGRAPRVDRRALGRLSAFSWPGNVRQLENEVQRALVMADDVIALEHLSPDVRGDTPSAPMDELDLKAQVKHLERNLVGTALERAQGNQTRAAKLLGVSRYGLQKMLKRLGVGQGA